MSSAVLSPARRLLSTDHVHIEKLKLQAMIGPDSWNQMKPQNLSVTLHMGTDFRHSAEKDDLNYSLNYAVISRDIMNYAQRNVTYNFKDISSFGRKLHQFTKSAYPGISELALEVESKEADIRSENLKAIVGYPKSGADKLIISNIRVLTLIGVFTFERLQKQYVDLTLEITTDGDVPFYRDIISRVTEYVEQSNFKTVEALAETVAQLVVEKDKFFVERPQLTMSVKVIKLNAITETSGVGVECIRCHEDFKNAAPIQLVPHITHQIDLPVHEQNLLNDDSWKEAILAFGSNIGDRFGNILNAFELLKGTDAVEITSTSSLFESEPMYFKNQQPFLNGCIKINTKLSPDELLQLCKKIEYEDMARVKLFENGPRTIDLDILMYFDSDGKDILMNSETLTLPHPRILERGFVLSPLCELIGPNTVHPITAEPIFNHLKQLYERGNPEDILWKLVPVGESFLKFKLVWEAHPITNEITASAKSPSYLMGIINVTPDSFSDGNSEYMNLEEIVGNVESMVHNALSLHEMVIVDIGGCSTRPGSQQTSENEELSRVIPVIEAIRKSNKLPLENIVISVDTYRANVAKAAIDCGAGIINDISGGTFDSDLYHVISQHPKVAYVLSHIRGDISTMSSQTDYSSVQQGANDFFNGKPIAQFKKHQLIRTVGKELCASYIAVQNQGVYRHQLIIDPGIGFAKVGHQNLELIRDVQLLKSYSCIVEGSYVNLANIPVLLGPSRKKFIGDITNTPNPKDRDFVTGALVAACVSSGCDIVRVHDVNNCSKALRIANELYRTS